jgi:excisionase family DNA binding protein
MAPSPLLTVRDVSQLLKVKEATVRTWIREQQMRAIKFGRDWRIREDDLEMFIEERANIDATQKRAGAA